jgi:hypothetical protein
MTDGPIRLNEVTRAAVDSGRLVHLATINPDGTPQVTCVYAAESVNLYGAPSGGFY